MVQNWGFQTPKYTTRSIQNVHQGLWAWGARCWLWKQTMALSNYLNNRNHEQGASTTYLCITSGKSSICTMGTLCVKWKKFVYMLWSMCSTYVPCISSPHPLRQCRGKPSDRLGPTSARAWSILVHVTTQKHVFWFHYIKNTKHLIIQKIE